MYSPSGPSHPCNPSLPPPRLNLASYEWELPEHQTNNKESEERRRRTMDGADLATPPSAHHQASSRPALGFPLGTALLLIVIFCLSGVFSCCYHWEKLRSLRLRRRPHHDDQQQPSGPSDVVSLEEGSLTQPSPPFPTSKITLKHQENNEKIQSVPVIMPGDEVPKFMARPCPCPEISVAVTLQTPFTSVSSPPNSL